MKSFRAISIESNDRTLITLSLIVGIAGLIVVVYAKSFAAMAELWQHSDYRYGVLVFPIVGYLLWRSRAVLADVELRPCAWGVAALAVLVLSWAVARAVGIQVVEQLCAVLLIPAAVVTFLGAKIARRILFPLVFLVAAVPVGEALVPFLMRATADVSVALVRVVGMPVFREGQFITLPGGRFEVADVCAGLHYLTSGTLIALLFAYFSYRSNLKRALFVAVAAATMVVGNGVRAFIVMLVASASDMRLLGGRDHVFFGWLLFGLIVFALLTVGLRFADLPEPRGADKPMVKGKTTRNELWLLVAVLVFVMLAATARDFQSEFSDWIILSVAAVLLGAVLLSGSRSSSSTPSSGLEVKPYRNWRAAVVICAACGVLGAGPLLMERSPSAAVQSYDADVLPLPPFADCGSVAPWSPQWRPDFEAPDLVMSGTYPCAEPVSVFVAAYFENAQGRKLMSDHNRVIPSEWSRYSRTADEAFEGAAGRSTAVTEVQVRGADGDSLIWFWYGVGERTATSTVTVKLLQAFQVIRAGRSDGEVYLLTTPLIPALEPARQRLRAVARQIPAAEARPAHRQTFDHNHE